MILDIAQIEALPTLHFCKAGATGKLAKAGKTRLRRHSISPHHHTLILSESASNVVVTVFCDCGGYGTEDVDAARVPSAVKVSITSLSTAESVCAAVANILGLYNDMDFSLCQFRSGFCRRIHDDDRVAEVLSTWTSNEVEAGEAVSNNHL